MAGEKTYGTPIQEVEIDGVYHKIEGSGSSGLTEISTQYIRITDLATGVYKLTYAGNKYIYYSGTAGTSMHTVTGGGGAVILTVNRYLTTYWHWYYINGTTGYETIYYGYTSTSSGSTSSKALNSLLTSHLYRPIQVNGTLILANTSGNALNLSNDGNVKFAQVSGGNVKANINNLGLTHIATIDSSIYYLNPRNLSYGATYVMYSVFNDAQLEFGYYNEDDGDYVWYGTYGGAVYITFRQDWQIFVYIQATNRYFTISMTDDFAIKSNYGPIEICELKH